MRMREWQDSKANPARTDQLVGLKMWVEAAKHYESLFDEWTRVGATESALDYGMYGCLCHLARPETLWARKMSEKCAKENKLWVESGQAKFMKSLLVVLVQKHYDEIAVLGRKYADEHRAAPVFSEIIRGIVCAFSDRMGK